MDLKKDFNLLIPKLFLARPKSKLVNTSWPKPQITYDKNTDCVDDFGSKLLNSFLMSAIFSFLKDLRCRQTSSGKLKIYQSGLDRLCAIHFLTLLWVLIHALGTT